MRRLTQEGVDSLWRMVEDLHHTSALQATDQMLSARCGQLKQPLVSCLGEKEMKSTVMEDHHTMYGQELTRDRRLRSERWGEHFQDLSGWCQPNKMSSKLSSQQSDEQLNTPIVAVQDEFNFGVKSSEDPLMSDTDCDLWDTTIPSTQGELWESVNDWLAHSPETTIDDVNHMFPKRELVKSDGDFLLSQSPASCKIKTEKTIKGSFINIIKSEPQDAKPYTMKSDYSKFFTKQIKKEPFFDMHSIFKSEEPFINDVDSSCTLIAPDKLTSPVDIHRDDMVVAEEIVVTSEEEPTKPLDVPTPQAYVKVEPAFRMPEAGVKPAARPKLKLDIDAALMTTQAETMDTPEVLQPLVEGIDGFSLLSYVCDDEANMLSTIMGNATKQLTCLTIPSQKAVKAPLNRYSTAKTGQRKRVRTIKEQPEQPSTLMSNRPKRKSAENVKIVSKKCCLSVDSDDIDSLNSIDTSYLSDSDESFSAKSKSNYKKRTNKSGRKRKASSADSDIESVGSTSDRYRELRDRNNEASRKSRLNRKSREIEMKVQAVQLEKDNRLLKIKADEMERLVKKLRENLMQIVMKRS